MKQGVLLICFQVPTIMSWFESSHEDFQFSHSMVARMKGNLNEIANAC
ncbi:hypothetical protein LOK49_LG06G00680 [Camellia lanceoleosa]|uniref:Uncharacterized protein n=1 Tax=Camellia lanceoleosa TaxID=1840588 RepID=A0ACC0HBL3_9ERIC|nr:hypothetical protein LOK49_LG06G00680 [Camellia lanceoleosa]